MSESAWLQLIGWVATMGTSIGYMRARLNDLGKHVDRMEAKVDVVKEVCDKCLGEKAAKEAR
ncbi:MAG: hypothetical protein WC683_07075 [bacterium]